MRRLFIFMSAAGFLLAGFLACFGLGAAGAQPVRVNVDGKRVDCADGAPYLDREAARVYVPLGFVSTALGAEVGWDAEAGAAAVRLAGKSIAISPGKAVPVIDGRPGAALDAPARLENGRLMVPVRFISETLGFEALWDAARAVVDIRGDGATAAPGGDPAGAFAFDLLGELYKPGENMFASPASVYMALAVLYNGASGETRAAMDKVLETRGLDAAAFNEKCAAVRKALAAPDERVTLNIADSLWLKQGLDFDAEFLRLAREYHGAQVRTLDFPDPAAPAVINGWIAEATNGMIKQMVEKIDPMTVLLLANAIYFHGEWHTEFDAAQTKPRDFVKADGTRAEVAMMHRDGMFPYFKGEDFAAVRLGYGENERLGMYVFVPDREADLDGLMAGLNAGSWDRWTAAFTVREGTVGLPRFKMECGIDLQRPLTALGLGILFAPGRADFSRMAPGGDEFFVGEARHKAVVEVDEKGTEAAAVTVIGVRCTSVGPDTGPFELIADRPFFFVIYDDRTDTVLFAGTLHNPKP